MSLTRWRRKWREADDLFVREARARLAALRRMPCLEQRPEHAAGRQSHAIVADRPRPDDVRTDLGASRLRPVTADAVNRPQCPPAIVRGRIDHRRSRDLLHRRRLIGSADDRHRQQDCAYHHD